EVGRQYAWADTVVVSLREWEPFAWTVPSKLYEVLATGRHITALLAGEAADVVREAEAGDVLPPEDDGALAALWRGLAADRSRVAVRASGRAWVADQADDDVLAERYLEILHRVTQEDRKSTRLNSSHVSISYAVFCLKKKNETKTKQLYKKESDKATTI